MFYFIKLIILILQETFYLFSSPYVLSHIREFDCGVGAAGALCKIKDVRVPVKTAFSETSRYTDTLVYLSKFAMILKL